MSVMSELGIETFRAPIMIAGSLGRYLAISARDHGTARAGWALGQMPEGCQTVLVSR
jgi:hypothetical protein